MRTSARPAARKQLGAGDTPGAAGFLKAFCEDCEISEHAAQVTPISLRCKGAGAGPGDGG